MATFIRVILIYLVALFSVTILPKLALFSALPNLILVLSLLFVFQKDFKKALFWALFGGLFLDFFGLSFPYNTFVTTVIVLLTWILTQRFFETSNIYLFLIFCFFGNLVFDSLFFLINRISLLTFHLILDGLYSTSSGLLFWFLYLYFQKRFKKTNLIEWQVR